MRVQRAPIAADQPARPDVSVATHVLHHSTAEPSVRETQFVSVDGLIDITVLRDRTADELVMTAELVIAITALAVEHSLVTNLESLRLIRLTPDGPTGREVRYEPGLSAKYIETELRAVGTTLTAAQPSSLTVLATGEAARVSGWRDGSAAVVSVGAPSPQVIDRAAGSGDGLTLMRRWFVAISVSVAGTAGSQLRGVHVLESLAAYLRQERA